MLTEIILYFFTVFGMMQFKLFLWELYTSKIVKNSSFIVVHGIKDKSKLSEIVYILRKYPLSIYAVDDNKDDYEEITETYDNVFHITKSQLNDIINGE